MREVFVIGAGGHGCEVVSYITQDPQAKCIGVIDDKVPPGRICGVEILGGLQAMDRLARSNPEKQFHFITALGDNATRRRVVDRIEALALPNLTAWTLTHPASHIGPEVSVGAGTLFSPNTIVTARSQIGDHCILNIKASISHDVRLGDFVNLNPNTTIAGNVEIGEGAYIGAGATVIEKIRIGKGVVVGAGSVVIRDVPDFVTVVGVPAQIIHKSMKPIERTKEA